MKNDMTLANILIGIVLIILIIVQTCRSVRLESRRENVERLCTELVTGNFHMDSLIEKYERLFKEMESDVSKEGVMKKRLEELDSLITERREKNDRLYEDYLYLDTVNKELKKSSSELADKSARIRREIEDGDRTIEKINDSIDFLKKVREGLEIAVANLPAEEVPYLSTPVFGMGVTPSISHKMEGYGIQYVGDIINLNEQFLSEIWGIGPVNLERIKAKMKENGVWFGMEVIRVNNRWYRRKCELIQE